MGGMIDPNDWRTWPRNGNRIEAPEGSPMEQRLAAVWALTCEEYGLDPDNPPPLRKDIIRIGHLRDQ
jgi:hypothetical protein